MSMTVMHMLKRGIDDVVKLVPVSLEQENGKQGDSSHRGDENPRSFHGIGESLMSGVEGGT